MHMAVILLTWDFLVERVRTMLNGAGVASLDALLALVVVLIGWLIASLLARLVLVLLRGLRFNEGVRRMLGADGPPLRHEPALLTARFVQGTVMVLSVMLAADALGFELTTSVGVRLREVLPRVVASSIVFIVGVAFAMMVGSVIARLLAGAGVRTARVRGQIVTIVLTGFAVLLALEQLGLAAQFIIALGLTAVAAVGLALGLAFGLGCRELARDFVVEYLRSLDEERPQRSS